MGQPDLSFLLWGMEPPQPPGDATSPAGMPERRSPERASGAVAQLIAELREDEGIAEADTLLLTVPNMLGVPYNAHVIESILTHVAPALGWR